jgi:hypothetical protein
MGEQHTCEEAHPRCTTFYVPCGKPANFQIHSDRDRRDYWMCRECASHSVKNRGMTVVKNLNGETI